ncbi:hypothetical protein [Flexivirga caeni]|nr:hypothetical protein [Flexivirga caeni]
MIRTNTTMAAISALRVPVPGGPAGLAAGTGRYAMRSPYRGTN